MTWGSIYKVSEFWRSHRVKRLVQNLHTRQFKTQKHFPSDNTELLALKSLCLINDRIKEAKHKPSLCFSEFLGHVDIAMVLVRKCTHDLHPNLFTTNWIALITSVHKA